MERREARREFREIVKEEVTRFGLERDTDFENAVSDGWNYN